MTSTKVVAMDADGLTVVCEDGTEQHLAADTIVAAFGMRADRTLVDKVDGKYHCKTRIGRARNIRGGPEAPLRTLLVMIYAR